MNIRSFLLSLLPVVAIGRLSLSFFPLEREFGSAERCALSFGMGWGLLTFQLFVYSFIGIPWSLLLVLLPWAGLIPFAFRKGLSLRKTPEEEKPPHPFIGVEWGFVYFLTFLFLYWMAEATAFPISFAEFWDAWAIWGLKAKAFYLAGSIRPLFFEYYPSYGGIHFSHPSYPLLLPLAESWVYRVSGTLAEEAVKFLFPGFLLSLMVLFHGSFRREGPRLLGLILVSLLSLLPIMGDYAIRAYAEIPLTFYYTVSTLYFYLWLRRESPGYLGIALFFSAFAAWTKIEGQALLVVNGLLFGSARMRGRGSLRRRVGEGVLCLAGPLLPILWWCWLLRQAGIPQEFVSTLTPERFTALFPRLPLIASALFRSVTDTSRWQFLWVGFFLFGLLFWREAVSFPRGCLLAAILCHLGLYVLILWIHPLDVGWVMAIDDTFQRLLLHAAPVTLFFLGLLLSPPGGQKGGERQSA